MTHPVVNSKVNSGVTSVSLDTELLKSAAGLTLDRSSNTVAPASDKYALGFGIKQSSDLIYNDQNGYKPVSGTIEHSGTVTFKTDILGPVTVGDFSVGYNGDRQSDKASGFYIKDTAGAGTVLFDVSNPDSLTGNSQSLNIGRSDLLVAPELNSYLNQNGLAKQSLTGADVGDIQLDALSIPVGIGSTSTSFTFPSIDIPAFEIPQVTVPQPTFSANFPFGHGH
jgi:hypothetical protein